MFIAFSLLSFLLKKKDAMIPCGVVNSTCKSVVYGMKHGPLSYRLVLPVKLSRPCTMHQATSSVWKHNMARKISLQYQKVMTFLPELFVQTDHSYWRTCIP